jgi:hypothetical protein
MVEQKLPKLTTRVRFPSPAPRFNGFLGQFRDTPGQYQLGRGGVRVATIEKRGQNQYRVKILAAG